MEKDKGNICKAIRAGKFRSCANTNKCIHTGIASIAWQDRIAFIHFQTLIG